MNVMYVCYGRIYGCICTFCMCVMCWYVCACAIVCYVMLRMYVMACMYVLSVCYVRAHVM